MSSRRPIYKRTRFWVTVGSAASGAAAVISYAVAGDWSAVFRALAAGIAATVGAQ